MATMVYATQVARYVPTASDTAKQVFWLRACAMAALAFVVHLAVALAGRSAADAKAYVVYAWRRWRLEGRIRAAERSSARRTLAAWTAFTDYRMKREWLVTACPGMSLELGPFDAITSDLLSACARSG